MTTFYIVPMGSGLVRGTVEGRDWTDAMQIADSEGWDVLDEYAVIPESTLESILSREEQWPEWLNSND